MNLHPFRRLGARLPNRFLFRAWVCRWWLGCAALFGAPLAAAELPDLFEERLASVVAVEFHVASELDRQLALSLGVVIDQEGTIILPAPAVNPRTTPSQLEDFRIYRPASPATRYAGATYLGQDAYTGWHFLRVEEAGREGLRPITDFAGEPAQREPRIGETVWGIGVRKKDEDFRPYLMLAPVSVVQSIPHRTAVAMDEVAGPGLPVFDQEGRFLGLGQPGFGESLLLFSRQRGADQVVLVDPDECAAFRLASEVLPNLERIPTNVFGRPLAWLGVGALEPLDQEVAAFLQLDGQSGLVVSEVHAGSPAEKGGLQARDIVLSVAGEPLPRLKPDGVLPAYFERELARRKPGDTFVLGVMRGKERVDLTIELAEAPTMPREAPRRYFDRLGFTAREMVYADAVDRRADPAASHGIIAHFVKPNGPTATAGLRMDDWIQQIDGVEVTDFAAAAEQLATIEADKSRSEFVLLVRRGSETAVLRVRLN